MKSVLRFLGERFAHRHGGEKLSAEEKDPKLATAVEAAREAVFGAAPCSHSDSPHDCESSNNSVVCLHGPIDDFSDNLAVVGNYEGVMSFIINAAKKKGMRLVENDFVNDDVKCLNHHIGIFRGDFCKTLDRIFECGESGLSTQQPLQNSSLSDDGINREQVLIHDSYANVSDQATASGSRR